MRRWRVTASIVKWACTGLGALILVAFFVSRWYIVDVYQSVLLSTAAGAPASVPRRGIVLLTGGVVFNTFDDGMVVTGPTSWSVQAGTIQQPMWGWSGGSYRQPNVSQERIQLYVPFAVVIVPACILWFFDLRAALRRRAGGCRECGYSRRGLAADANCPECGTVPMPR